MQPLVCSPVLDKYLLINRLNRQTLQLPTQLYQHFWETQAAPGNKIPQTLQLLLPQLGITNGPSDLSQLLLVRPVSELGYARASYEVNEACNLRCKHCILAHRHRANLPLDQRYLLLDTIADAGCLWLQLTGGEATVDKYFAETYEYAYSKGFLIILSTNGSRLSEPRIRQLLSQYPPYRVAISIYGATAESFTALTQDEDEYAHFLAGLQAAQELKLNVRTNIIKTVFNQGEIDDMRQLAERFGFPHHTYSELLPTFDGSSHPFYVMSECDPTQPVLTAEAISHIPQGETWLDRCGAGRTFFHVDCLGQASICQSARSMQVNLLTEGVAALSQVTDFSLTLMETPVACPGCPLWTTCLNCPPKLALYRQAGGIPDYVCQFQQT